MEGSMNPEQVHEFRASLKRCLATPEFLRSFYDLFMSHSDEIRAKFRQTDFTRQTRVLADSLYAMAVVAQGEPESPAWAEIDRLGQNHARDQLDIRPEHYDVWLDSLVRAARQYDAQFTPELERAWRETLSAGIERMRARY
jgi:hemoglobin-like flavoprotein